MKIAFLLAYETKPWFSGGVRPFFAFSSKSFKVSSITLADIIHKFGEVDLLKLDIEGAEFEVLNKLNNQDFKNIKNIVAERHLEFGNINKGEHFLKENGYYVQKFTPPLLRKNVSYSIKLIDFNSLKLFRKFVYMLSNLAGIKDNTLAILFARRENEK